LQELGSKLGMAIEKALQNSSTTRVVASAARAGGD
jgi:hypothetical protein